MSNSKTEDNEASTFTKPLISVVTVVYNGSEYIEQTIQAVINQTYDNVEYIVIDGGSTDGTVDIIRKYEGAIDCWISEPDDGIYSAMNKGIVLAKGEWINFMNGGDLFYEMDTLKKVVLELHNNVEMVYGCHQISYPNGHCRIHKPDVLESIWKGLPFSHQSLFVRIPLMKKHLFSSANKMGADYEFVYKAYTEGCRIKEIDIVVATTSAHGVSDVERVKAIRSMWKVSAGVSNQLWVNPYFIYLLFDHALRKTLKSILPKAMIERLIAMK